MEYARVIPRTISYCVLQLRVERSLIEDKLKLYVFYF